MVHTFPPLTTPIQMLHLLLRILFLLATHILPLTGYQNEQVGTVLALNG